MRALQVIALVVALTGSGAIAVGLSFASAGNDVAGLYACALGATALSLCSRLVPERTS